MQEEDEGREAVGGARMHLETFNSDGFRALASECRLPRTSRLETMLSGGARMHRETFFSASFRMCGSESKQTAPGGASVRARNMP